MVASKASWERGHDLGKPGHLMVNPCSFQVLTCFFQFSFFLDPSFFGFFFFKFGSFLHLVNVRGFVSHVISAGTKRAF